MIERVTYNNKGGMGIIANEPLPLRLESVMLHGQTLEPNQFTTLDGLFDGEVKYVGLFNDTTHKIMCFHLGKSDGLDYYSCFMHLSDTRIANKYKEYTARDFNWNGHRWK